MAKALVLCCSDILGIPAIIKLKQLDMLSAIAVTDKVSGQFIPMLKSIGCNSDELHVLTKANLETELIALIEQYKPDALFTLTFSWMVPDRILKLLPNRCINFHFGLLPKYRGAEPIFWTMKNGETQGGLSVHIMTNEVDNGPILSTEFLQIFSGETYGLYSQRLSLVAADKAVSILGNLETYCMNSNSAEDFETHLPCKMPQSADLRINWNQQTAQEILRSVNASNPRYSGSVTYFNGVQINFFEVTMVTVNNPNNEKYAPGTIVISNSTDGLIVACIEEQFLKVDVAALQQGYFSGAKLTQLGFGVGVAFK